MPTVDSSKIDQKLKAANGSLVHLNGQPDGWDRQRVVHMTVRKNENTLRGDRTPAYVGRETGAAELQISPDTWDQWVKDGRLPPPCDTFPSGTPRWRWEDVDRKLSGKTEAADTDEAAAFIRGAHHIAKKKGSRRAAA
jgi:hypothetical protein